MRTCPHCSLTYEGEHDCIGSTLTKADTERVVEAPSLLPGDKVGEYVVEQHVGSGGFGQVYRVVHPVIRKKAAVKVLDRSMAASPIHVSRFVAEARAANEIGHPNIIDIFGFGTIEGGQHYYLMEYIEGETLERHLARNKNLSLDEAMPILRQIGAALDAAHQRGIVHRDLKPSNVMIAVGGEVKLLDFGIAKLLSTDGQRGHKTKTGSPIGTPQYMAPEQGRGRPVDHRADIYAFGVVTYEMLTGIRPFHDESAFVTMMKHISEDPTPPSQVRSALAPWLDPIVLRMLSKDPTQRPQSLAEALALLERTDSPRTSRAEPRRGSRWIAAGLAALALAAVARFWPGSEAKPSPAPLPTPVAVGRPPPPLPATVGLAVFGSPEDFEIFEHYSGRRLGRNAEVISLPRSETPLTIEIRAEGHESQLREVTPDLNHALTVDLHKLAAKSRTVSKPRTAATHDDLESPFK